MRSLILGAAALLAVALPGVASAETRAALGIHYSSTDSDAFGGDNIDTWGLNGGFSNDFANGWTLQMDGSEDRLDVASSEVGQGYAAVSLGVRTDTHAIYGSVGMTDFIASSGTAVGIGGQLYFSNIVLDGSVAYSDFGDGLLGDFNVTNVHVDGTYFFNDNLGISAQVAHTEADASGGGDTDWNTYGISGEYRFANSPVSINVGYKTQEFDSDNADTWSIGLTYDLGTGSLRDRATTGPSWNALKSVYEESLGAL